MRAHALALLKRSERHHRREQRHALAGAGRGLGQRRQRGPGRRGVQGLGDDARELSLLVAKCGQGPVGREHPLDERRHRPDRGPHRSIPPACAAEYGELDVGGGEHQPVQQVRILSPSPSEAHERAVNGQGVGSERPLPAEPAEREQRAALGFPPGEAVRKAAKTGGVHELGALGMAHRKPVRCAEHEHRRREVARVPRRRG